MKKALINTLIAFTFLFWAGVAFAQSCEPGWGLCPTGGCAPIGSICTATGYVPAGSVVCSDGKYCPSGTICTAPGENECIERTSTRVCSDGRSYCGSSQICTNDNKCLEFMAPEVCADGRSYCESGMFCGSDNKCYSQNSPPPSGSNNESDDQSSGVSDARHCIEVIGNSGRGSYNVHNFCTFGVRVSLETKDITKSTSVDSYYIGAGDNILTYSYFGHMPVVITATGR